MPDINNKIIVKCIICGCDICLSKSSYRKNKLYKCRKCLAKEAKERYNNLSSEEKQRRAEISKSRMKTYWSNMSSEDKQKRLDVLNNGFKNYNQNLSDKERNKMSIILSNSQKKRWKSTSDEKKKEITKPMHDAAKVWYNSLSDDDKKKHHEYIQNGNKKWWNSISDEEYKRLSQIRSDSSKKYWNNVSEEDIKIISERQSKIIKQFWNNMTDDDYKKWDAKRAEGFNKYMDGLITSLNKNELSVIDYLKINDLKYKYHWYNITKHPEFDKLFPINPVTGSKFISPYHQWDFIIHTIEKDVLVDIDGSIHDNNKINHMITYFNGKKISLSDLILFNDSQRPYQTDGLDAYIIQCYDDNLTDNTPVINISTNENMAFKSFIALLIFYDMEYKEKIKLIKDLKSYKLQRLSTSYSDGEIPH